MNLRLKSLILATITSSLKILMYWAIHAEIALLPLRHQMKGFVGVTDNGWFAFLSQQPGIDEDNFLQ